MPQAFDYPELTTVDDGDVIGVVDASDTTDAETGSTKYCTRVALFGGPRVKTASELSSTSALQDYIDDCLEAYGFCQLPPGVIDITGTITLNKRQGGVIRGCGLHAMPTYSTGNGWNNPSLSTRYSTIIRRASGSGPIFDLNSFYCGTIQHLGLETDGVAIQYRNTDTTYPSFYGLFERLSFHPKTEGAGTTTAILAGESGVNNAADLEVRSCLFSRLEHGLHVQHDQGVCFHFSGTNIFGYCDNAIYLEKGGNIVADCLTGYGMRTWVRMVGTTGNNRNNLFHFIKSDRTTDLRPAVICDMTAATGGATAIFNCVAISTSDPTADLAAWPDHYAMLLPTDHVSLGAEIILPDDTSTWRKPSGTSYTPTVADNPFDA